MLDTLSALADCLESPVLIDLAPSEVSHNRRAAMLRQGQAVLLFSAMETFLRDRTAEVLQSFDAAVVSFSGLSEKLQTAVTLGAMHGLQNRVKAQDKQLQSSWLMTEAAAIASASTSLSTLSRYSFAHDRSNIAEDDVSNILSAFGVDKPWESITAVTGRSGASLPDAKAEFIAIKKRRHSSAHVVTGAVPHADLEQSLLAVRSICAAFDLLISKARILANRGNFPGVGGNSKLIGATLSLVFVQPRSGKFIVVREQQAPPQPPLRRTTVRVLDDLAAAQRFGRTYASKSGSFLLLRDASGIPRDWET